jgi:hypothetical protein
MSSALHVATAPVRRRRPHPPRVGGISIPVASGGKVVDHEGCRERFRGVGEGVAARAWRDWRPGQHRSVCSARPLLICGARPARSAAGAGPSPASPTAGSPAPARGCRRPSSASRPAADRDRPASRRRGTGGAPNSRRTGRPPWRRHEPGEEQRAQAGQAPRGGRADDGVHVGLQRWRGLMHASPNVGPVERTWFSRLLAPRVTNGDRGVAGTTTTKAAMILLFHFQDGPHDSGSGSRS